jgi:hypothetical protein
VPTYTALLIGGPCAFSNVKVTASGKSPPATTRCKGVTYYLSPSRSENVLVYTTQDQRSVAEGGHIRGQRDVFAAFRALVGALHKTVPGELRRVDGARRRIRRAVK